MKLLVQNDDYGITSGVSAGIREAIARGIVRNTGMFVNMPASYQAAQDIKNMDICLGIDINYVCGKPVSDPSAVSHMVDENGYFYSSGEVIKRNKFLSMGELNLISIFEKDPYPYDEIYLETENQVKKFIEIVGRKPEYMHMHSLCTPNTLKAALEVAKKYEIYHSINMMREYQAVPGTFDGAKGNTMEDQMKYDVEGNLLHMALPQLDMDETRYFICHGGYVDYDLFRYTSLILRRIKDLDAMLSDKLKDYINNYDIELITYRDLKQRK